MLCRLNIYAIEYESEFVVATVCSPVEASKHAILPAQQQQHGIQRTTSIISAP